jgi:hypothetical protein
MTDMHDEYPHTACVAAQREPGEGRKAAAQAGLSSPQADLHRHILRAFLATGKPPVAGDVRHMASGLGLDPREAMRRLADADLVHTDPATGIVVAAYPFSGVPTPHVVRLDDTPPVHAMCAIDALGIPLMAGRDGVISSASPGTHDPITVEYRVGTWRWSPATAAVLVADSGGEGPSQCRSCPFITFHATAEQAAAYLTDCATASGQVVTQAEAVNAAQAEFARLLTG